MIFIIFKDERQENSNGKQHREIKKGLLAVCLDLLPPRDSFSPGPRDHKYLYSLPT
jgi:hypothetical protein